MSGAELFSFSFSVFGSLCWLRYIMPSFFFYSFFPRSWFLKMYSSINGVMVHIGAGCYL